MASVWTFPMKPAPRTAVLIFFITDEWILSRGWSRNVVDQETMYHCPEMQLGSDRLGFIQ
jgi:hypothetical protein